mmetsp:Transcript_3399/g.7067  ORF Transcript_3399/g.7067 Transcript_3399/m.7067 type:complete len:216 (-) Transcript_3399:1040-1687(-)
MMIPSPPAVSNCGRPARPKICITSSTPRSTKAPRDASYTCVPLMMTVCAGRLTPHASVAVQTSTLMSPSPKSRSMSDRSGRSIPAWWMPKPLAKSVRSSWLRDLSTSFLASPSRGCSCCGANISVSPRLVASSASARAVRCVSLRACTNTITCLPLRSAASAFSYVTSIMRALRSATFLAVMPMKVCLSGTGRYAELKWKSPLCGLTRRKSATSK